MLEQGMITPYGMIEVGSLDVESTNKPEKTYSLYFDGVSTYGRTSSHLSELTVSVMNTTTTEVEWVMDRTHSYGYIVSQKKAEDYDFSLYTLNDGRLRLVYGGETTDLASLTGSTDLHTYRVKLYSNGTYKVYVDDVMLTNGSHTRGTEEALYSAFTVGSFDPNPLGVKLGIISDIKLWSGGSLIVDIPLHSEGVSPQPDLTGTTTGLYLNNVDHNSDWVEI